jgi:hypothetical protein
VNQPDKEGYRWVPGRIHHAVARPDSPSEICSDFAKEYLPVDDKDRVAQGSELDRLTGRTRRRVVVDDKACQAVVDPADDRSKSQKARRERRPVVKDFYLAERKAF